MRPGTSVILVVAVLSGLLAAFLARGILTSQREASRAVETKIVVAAQPLRFGAALTRENLVEEKWGDAPLPEGAFASIDSLLKDGERVALQPIAKNEPVLESRVSGAGHKASLAALIEPGKRAVTIRVDDVRGVAGFIMPGDRVDVVLTRSEDKETFTDVLLQGVRVLAIDQLAVERKENAQVAKAVTLEVTTEQAQKLVLASGAGTLSLLLRDASGTNSESARRVTLPDLGQSESALANKNKEPAEIPSAPPPSEPPSTTVKIIRGASVKEVTVFHQRPD